MHCVSGLSQTVHLPVFFPLGHTPFNPPLPPPPKCTLYVHRQVYAVLLRLPDKDLTPLDLILSRR